MIKKNDKISVDEKYNIGNITHRQDYQQIRHYQIKNSKLEEKNNRNYSNETKEKQIEKLMNRELVSCEKISDGLIYV